MVTVEQMLEYSILVLKKTLIVDFCGVRVTTHSGDINTTVVLEVSDCSL